MNLPVEQRKEWIRSRREQRKLTKRARFHRQVLRYTLLTLVLAAGAIAFHYMPWFLSARPNDIMVRGNLVATDAQIRNAIENAHKAPLYSLNPSLLEKQIEQLSIIKHAFVRRYALPKPIILVEVMEEFPWASYSIGLEDSKALPLWVIAESGRVVSAEEFPAVFRPALKIYGDTPTLAFTAQLVNQWANWIAYIEKQTGQKVEYIDMRQRQNVRVKVGDLYLKLGTPDSTLSRRLGRLASVLAAIGPMRSKIEYIDLGLDNNIPMKLAHKLDNAKKSVRENNEHSEL